MHLVGEWNPLYMSLMSIRLACYPAPAGRWWNKPPLANTPRYHVVDSNFRSLAITVKFFDVQEAKGVSYVGKYE